MVFGGGQISANFLWRRALLYIPFSIFPFILDLVVVFLLRTTGVTNFWSFFVAACFGTAASFAINKFWVFGKSKSGRTRREISLFGWLSLLSFVIGTLPGLVLDVFFQPSALMSLVVRIGTLGILWICKFVVMHVWIFPAESQ